MSLLLLACLSATQAFAPDESPRGLRHPALSPDGARLAFSYLGDLWICPAEGGRAERLTRTPAHEDKPCWSPDGLHLAYSSDAENNRDIYVLRLSDRAARRLTHHTGVDDKPDWSPDGRFIAFHSDRDKLLNLPVASQVFDVWCVRAEGGTPWRLTRWRGENPAWSPDGKLLAYDYYASGYGDGEHDVALLRMEDGWPAPGALPRVVAGGREDTRKPTWKGDAVFLAHEAHGIGSRPIPNLWRARADGGALVQVTGYDADRVSWPTTSAGGNLVVFEHAFGLSAIDASARGAAPFALEIRIDPQERPADDEERVRTISAGAWSPAWSPRGDAVLVELEGDLWKLAPDASSAERLTHGEAEDTDPAWAPDARGFVFVRADPGRPGRLMRWTDGNLAAVSDRVGTYRSPAVAPDGARVACVREQDGASQIVLFEADGRPRVVAEQPNVALRAPLFAADDALLFAATTVRAGKAESKIVRQSIDGGARVEIHAGPGLIEDLAAGPGGALAWTLADGSSDNPRIHLWRDGAVTELHDGEKVSRFHPTWAPDGSMILFVESRRADGRMARRDPQARLVVRDVSDPAGMLELSLRARLRQTPAEFNRYLFDVVWGTYRREYYDPFLHGAPWEALREKYLPIVTQSRTAADRHDWINRMIGELRSSHVALHARPPSGDLQTCSPGVEVEPLADGTLRVTAVLPGGPAEGAGIRVGELITAVGETSLTPERDFDELCALPRGRRREADLALAVRDPNGDVRIVRVDPLSGAELRELRYRRLLEERRKIVAEASEGRLLYHAIRFMAASEVAALARALAEGAEKEALVLDARDGQGGLAHKQVLRLLDETAPERLDKNPACSIRYRDGRAQFDVYGRRAAESDPEAPSWNKPVVLIINEVSRSDKEILAYTFRHLKLGYIVGTPTAGGVIGGSDRPLADGTSITVSVQGWFTHDGRNLEGSGVTPDFVVPIRPADYDAGRDPQLERAVEVLMAQMAGRIPTLQKE
jgi:Tol biopolymer transport system component/C-terminal processing protease CtpA/Prc